MISSPESDQAYAERGSGVNSYSMYDDVVIVAAKVSCLEAWLNKIGRANCRTVFALLAIGEAERGETISSNELLANLRRRT